MQQNILRQAIAPKNYNSKLIQYKLALKQKFKQKNNPLLKPSESRFYSKMNPAISTYRVNSKNYHYQGHNNTYEKYTNQSCVNIQKAPLFQKPQSPKYKSNYKLNLKLNRARTQPDQNGFKLSISSMRSDNRLNQVQEKYFQSKNRPNDLYCKNEGGRKPRSFSASYYVKSSANRQNRKLSFQNRKQVFCIKEGWNTFNNQQEFQYF